MKKIHYFGVFTSFLAFFVFFAGSAHAQDTVNTVVLNIWDSTHRLPGLLAALAYLTGVLMGTLGIMKTIDHVSNPTQTPIRAPIVRFLVGGGLFALPVVLEAAYRTINGNGASTLDIDDASDPLLPTTVVAQTLALLQFSFNTILVSITDNTELVPGLIAIIAYMLGLLLTLNGLLYIRDHVDSPEKVTLKEPVIRLLIAGALFALPTVFTAMYETIAQGGFSGSTTLFLTNVISTAWFSSDDTGGLLLGMNCDPLTTPFGTSLGHVICTLQNHTIGLPTFLTALSYVLGLIFGVWGLLKIKDHVLNPTQTKLSEGVTRLFAGGAFFAMPFVATIISATVTPVGLAALSGIAPTNTGFVDDALLTCTLGLGSNSLDHAFLCLMYNVMGPMQVLTNFFCIVAGMIFIMIGISRLIRSSQEGARGPGGRGTVATFLVGGVLLSANAILRGASFSLFYNPITRTSASLSYTGGMTLAELQATYNVISGVLRFMIIIGFISFVRGIFIMRDVAEGNQQASTMAGITHIIGGALAVNLGPLLNAVQSSLGVTAFGVSFT